MASRPRLWVYKNRSYADVHQTAYGDWEEFFDTSEATEEPVPWGGSWASALDHQKRVFREDIKVGDLILCWQTDRQAALGIATVVSVTERQDGESELWLRAVERFPRPVRLHQIKKVTYPKLQQVSALKRGPMHTIYETSSQEAYWLLDAAGSSQSHFFK
jgi:hypothetical protein